MHTLRYQERTEEGSASIRLFPAQFPGRGQDSTHEDGDLPLPAVWRTLRPELLSIITGVRTPELTPTEIPFKGDTPNSAAAAIAKDQYRNTREIGLLEAQALALEDLNEARERRRRADEAEARFISEFLDELEDESEQ